MPVSDFPPSPRHSRCMCLQPRKPSGCSLPPPAQPLTHHWARLGSQSSMELSQALGCGGIGGLRTPPLSPTLHLPLLLPPHPLSQEKPEAASTELLAVCPHLPRGMAREVWTLEDFTLERELSAGGDAAKVRRAAPYRRDITSSTCVGPTCCMPQGAWNRVGGGQPIPRSPIAVDSFTATVRSICLPPRNVMYPKAASTCNTRHAGATRGTLMQ
eukprot:350755-Chlamydomonas_euryale.AAC.5